jgi:translation initiation factor 2D
MYLSCDLIVSVYTLWKRIFLPVITTPQLVIDKMRHGADLMAPGVVSILPSHTTPLPIPIDELVCVIPHSRDALLPPMAIGRMGMSSNEIQAADKGKAVLTLHTYGDALWEKGGKLEPPKEISWIRPDAVPSTSEQVETAPIDLHEESESHVTHEGGNDPLLSPHITEPEVLQNEQPSPAGAFDPFPYCTANNN